MSATGPAFVTPHAVAQFRARVAPELDYERALAAILRGLATPTRVQGRPGVSARTVHCRGWRAIVKPPPRRGLLPVVVTILAEA